MTCRTRSRGGRAKDPPGSGWVRGCMERDLSPCRTTTWDDDGGHMISWQGQYAALVCVSDLIVIVAGVIAMIVIGMPSAADAEPIHLPAAQRAHVVSGLSAAGLLLIGLLATHAWDPRILGYGS